MVIALNEVADEPFVSRAIILVVVAIGITVLVYGVVGAHREDGRHRPAPRAGASRAPRARVGRGMVAGDAEAARRRSRRSASRRCSGSAGTSCSSGVDELGWHALYDVVHHAEEAVGGGALGWCVNTLASAVIGLVVGALVVAVVTLVKRFRSGREHESTPAAH